MVVIPRSNRATRWLGTQGRRVNRLPVVIRVSAAVLLLAVSSLAGLAIAGSPSPSAADNSSSALVSNRLGNVGLPRFFGPKGTKPLAPATNRPAPAPPSVANAAPLGSHEVFGFAPYWMLGSSWGST